MCLGSLGYFPAGILSVCLVLCHVFFFPLSSLFKRLCPTLEIDSFPPLRTCSLCVFNYFSYLALKRGILLFEFLISAWWLQFAYLSHVVLCFGFFSRPIMSFPVFPSACFILLPLHLGGPYTLRGTLIQCTEPFWYTLKTQKVVDGIVFPI